MGDLDVVDGAVRSVTCIALDEGCLLVQVRARAGMRALDARALDVRARVRWTCAGRAGRACVRACAGRGVPAGAGACVRALVQRQQQQQAS